MNWANLINLVYICPDLQAAAVSWYAAVSGQNANLVGVIQSKVYGTLIVRRPDEMKVRTPLSEMRKCSASVTSISQVISVPSGSSAA